VSFAPPKQLSWPPSVTVLMPSYNRADLIQATIESVLAQSWSNFELLCCDDGSQDETWGILESFAAQDPRVRLLRNRENRGRPFTRNRLVETAESEFILWMDDDDLLAPQALEHYLELLREYPETDVIYGNLQIFDHQTGADLQLYKPNDWTGREEELLGAKLYGSCIPNGGSFIRRSLILKAGGYDERFLRAQDYEFWTRAVSLGRFRKIPEILYRYRKHAGCISFGALIDLSYDSLIIRQHLSRHPLSMLFPALDWSCPLLAEMEAGLKVAENLMSYQDPHNALVHLESLPQARFDPDLVKARARAFLMMGQRTKAEEARAELLRLRPDLQGECQELTQLHAWLKQARALKRRPKIAEQQAEAIGASLAWAQTQAEAGGEEAARWAQLALRLRPGDSKLLGWATRFSGNTQRLLEALQGRLLEPEYRPKQSPAPPIEGPLVSLIIPEGPGAEGSLQSSLLQEYWNLELLWVGNPPRAEDPRLRILKKSSSRQEAWTLGGAEAQGAALLFVVPGDLLLPDHVGGLVEALGDEGEIAYSQLRVQGERGEERQPARLERTRLLAYESLPLSALLFRAEHAPEFRALEYAGWDAVISACRGGTARSSERPSCLMAVRSPARHALLQLYGMHTAEALLKGSIRDAQAQHLESLGVAQGRLSPSGVLLLAREACLPAIQAIQGGTEVLYTLRLLAQGPEALQDLPEGLRLLKLSGSLSSSQALNRGLSLADGEFVALIYPDVLVPPAWLGRLQWWARRDLRCGLVQPGGEPGAPLSRLSPHILLITRGLLERLGGFDPRLQGQVALDDYLLRARLAGFEALGADVEAPTPARLPPLDPDSLRAFKEKWGFAPGANLQAEGPFEADQHHQVIGAEPGFRADSPKVQIEEAATHNLLISPPLSALPQLLERLSAQPPGDWACWIRVPIGAGPRLREELKALPLSLEAHQILLVDAPLALEREAGLYTAADAIYLDPSWPEAERERRRAADCDRPLLMLDELGAWITALSGC